MHEGWCGNDAEEARRSATSTNQTMQSQQQSMRWRRLTVVSLLGVISDTLRNDIGVILHLLLLTRERGRIMTLQFGTLHAGAFSRFGLGFVVMAMSAVVATVTLLAISVSRYSNRRMLGPTPEQRLFAQR